MAVVALTPATLNATYRQGQYQKFKSGIVKDLTGTAINLSGWASFDCVLVQGSALTPGSTPLNVGTATGNADGTVDVAFAAADFGGVPAGNMTICATGVHVGGDDPQLLATGAFTLLTSI